MSQRCTILRSISLSLPLAVVLAWPGVSAAQKLRGPVTVPAGTPVTVRLNQQLSTRSARAGSRFSGTLAKSIRVNGNVVLPQGAQVFGTVLESRRAGRLQGRAQIALRLDSIQANGRTYPVMTVGGNIRGQRGRSRNLRWIGGSAAGGTVIGAIAGGGAGALIGAGVGAAGGTAAAAATRSRNLTLAAETPLTFELAKPVTMKQPLQAKR